MTGNDTGDWHQLCKAASQECDPKKLLDLIRQINQALSQQRTRAPESQANHT